MRNCAQECPPAAKAEEEEVFSISSIDMTTKLNQAPNRKSEIMHRHFMVPLSRMAYKHLDITAHEAPTILRIRFAGTHFSSGVLLRQQRTLDTSFDDRLLEANEVEFKPHAF